MDEFMINIIWYKLARTAFEYKEEKKMDTRNWDLFDVLIEVLGGAKLAEELIRYMSSDTANRYLESVAREYEIEYEEEED